MTNENMKRHSVQMLATLGIAADKLEPMRERTEELIIQGESPAVAATMALVEQMSDEAKLTPLGQAIVKGVENKGKAGVIEMELKNFDDLKAMIEKMGGPDITKPMMQPRAATEAEVAAFANTNYRPREHDVVAWRPEFNQSSDLLAVDGEFVVTSFDPNAKLTTQNGAIYDRLDTSLALMVPCGSPTCRTLHFVEVLVDSRRLKLVRRDADH